MHERVIIVSATSANVPHVPAEERFSVDDLGHTDDGVQHLGIRFGFSDAPDLPAALREASRGRAAGAVRGRGRGHRVVLRLARGDLRRTRAPGMARWRKALFVALAHNAADPSAYFRLPPHRTVTMGSDVEV